MNSSTNTTAPPSAGSPKSRSGAALTATLALVSGIAPLATDMYLPAFPTMAADLGTDTTGVQLTLTAFFIGMALGQLIIGPISDMWGRRKLLIAGTLLCAIAGALAALAPGVGVLVATRFLQGFGGAAGVVLARAVISDIAQGLRAAKLFAVMMVVQGVAPVGAPLLGAFLVPAVGWRGVFVVLAVLSAIMTAAAFFVIPETLAPQRRQRDGIRSLLRSMGSVLANRTFMYLSVALACAIAVLFAYISASSFVLQNILGLSPTTYGLAFAINGVAVSVASAISAKAIGRFSASGLLRFGLTVMILAALAVLACALAGAGLWPFLVSVTCVTFGLGFVLPNATSLALAQVPDAAGTGSALMGTMQSLASALVAPLVGVAGAASAMPMAVVMLIAGVAAAVFSLLGLRRIPVPQLP